MNVTKPLTAVRVTVPSSVPVPRPRLTLTTLLLSVVIRFPKESSIRTTGCWAKATPAVAAADGWVPSVNRLAVAAPTLKTLLAALVNPLALAVSCLFVPAKSISKLVKLPTPFPAAVPTSTLVVPSSGPVPAVSARLTTRLAANPVVELFPN